MGCISVLSEITVQNNVNLNLQCKQVVLLASYDHKVHKVATDDWKAGDSGPDIPFLSLLWKRRCSQNSHQSSHPPGLKEMMVQGPGRNGWTVHSAQYKGSTAHSKIHGLQGSGFFSMLRIRILMLKEIQGRFLNMDSRMQLLRNLWMSSHTHTLTPNSPDD